MLTKIKIWLFISVLKHWYGFSGISTMVIYGQAAHETGNFKSTIFKENKNLFGMRQAKIRKNYANGSNRGHATFSNLFNSVRDYFERQKNFRISGANDTGFINDTVKSNYATDPRYKEKWIGFINADKKPISTGLFIAIFFFIVILLILWRSLWRRLWNGSNSFTIFTKTAKPKKVNFKKS